MRVSIILIGLGLMLGLPANVQAVDPDVKCNADKVKEATKYASCLGKAESKAIKKGTDPSADIAKCDSKYSAKWQKAESKAGGACPTNGDEAAIQAQVQQCVADLVEALSCQPGAAGVGGACWYLGALDESCDMACINAGLIYDASTETYAGSGGTLLQCNAVLDALGQTSPPLSEVGPSTCSTGAGCLATISNFGGRVWCVTPDTTGSASRADWQRACACQ